MWNGTTSDALRATQFLIFSSPHRPIPGPLIQRRIVGYHQDQLGDWVAELECGHGQHVRHDPPWQVREWVTGGLVNIVGGCCGTTPLHIAAIAGATRDSTPRAVPAAQQGTLLAGLEPMLIAA